MRALPPVGKRMIKSAIAVFLCLVVNQLRQGAGVVFYSCIAAVLCMQQDAASSKRTGRNRVIGTMLGGLFGLLLLVVEQRFGWTHWLFHALLVSICIVAIIYVTVLFHQTSASYISCVVFMSITISHIHDANPYVFAANRVLDTLIGIAISYGVNSVHLPAPKGKELLWLCDITALTHAAKPSHSVELRRLQERGMRLVLHTLLPIAADAPFLQSIQAKEIVMFGGSVLYEAAGMHYRVLHSLSQTQSRALAALCKAKGLCSFAYAPYQDIMHVYVGMTERNAPGEKLFDQLRKAPGHACSFDAIPKDREICALSVIVPHGELSAFRSCIPDDLHVRTLFQQMDEKHTLLLFCSASASCGQALSQLPAYERLCVIAHTMVEEALFDRCECVYVSDETHPALHRWKRRYPCMLINDPLKEMRRRFYARRPLS